MRLLRFAPWVSVLCVILCVSGCLTSETPLLTDETARATPLEPGLYDACSTSDDAGKGGCHEVTVRLEGVLYSFESPGEDASLGRFRSLGGRKYMAQMWEDGDTSYLYFYAEKTKDGARLAMVSCADVPSDTRARLAAKGGLAVTSDAAVCTARDLKSAEGAVRAYGRAHAADADQLVLTRKKDQ